MSSCRALEFVYWFLDSVLSGEEDLVVSANVAYEKSLKKYHGWIVSGIFKVRVLEQVNKSVSH